MDTKNENSIDDEKSFSIPVLEQRFYTIGEVSEICGLKNHILRYWEHEFPKLKPRKRRGNRRFYERNDVILILKIKDLLYTRKFTIPGARAELESECSSSDNQGQNDLTQMIQQLENIIESL